MSFAVPNDSAASANVSCTLAAGLCTCIATVWMLTTYVVHRERLRCAFNDLAAMVAVLQGLESLQKVVVCVVALTTGAVSFPLCDVSGSLDQLLNVSAQILVTAFFLYMASTSARMRGLPWNAAYVVTVLCSVVTLSCCWIYIHDGAHTPLVEPTPVPPLPPMVEGSDPSTMHFTLEVGWCWLPSCAAWYTGFSQRELNWLRFGCSYVFSLLFLVTSAAAMASMLRGNCANGGLRRVPGIIFVRLLGLCVYPLAAYGVGAVARFTGDSSTRSTSVDAATSFLLPLCGCWNAVVFLGTERAFTALVRTERPSFSAGFANAVRVLSCDTVVGEATFMLEGNPNAEHLRGDSRLASGVAASRNASLMLK